MPNKTIKFGPKWPGLNLKHDPTAHSMATVSKDLRRDRMRLEGLYPPKLVATDGVGEILGLFLHPKENLETIRLSSALLPGGTRRLLANGKETLRIDGERVTLADDLVCFARLGSRTFFTDGVSALRFYDARPTAASNAGVSDPAEGAIFELIYPDAPTAEATSTGSLKETVFDGLSATLGTSFDGNSANAGLWLTTVQDPPITRTPEDNKWYFCAATSDKAFSFKPALENVSGEETEYFSIDGAGGPNVGTYVIQWYAEDNALRDFSAYDEISFEINSRKSGSFLAFVLSENDGLATDGTTPAPEIELPFTVTQKEVWLKITLDLTLIPQDDRDNIRRWGFKATTDWDLGGTDFYIRNVKATSGVKGDVSYIVTAVTKFGDGKTDAWAIELESKESEAVEVEGAGDFASLSLKWKHKRGATHYKVYRWDKSVTEGYQFAGEVVAPAGAVPDTTDVTYTDTAYSISSNPYLIRDRAPAPRGASCVGIHRSRILLGAGEDLWISDTNDPCTFRDITFAQSFDYELSDYAGLKIPDLGRIVAIANLGVFTGADYLGDTLIFTQGEIIRLTGTKPEEFETGYHTSGGTVSVMGWTRDDKGNIYYIDQTGDVWVITPRLTKKKISEPLEEYLRTIPPEMRAYWLIGFDPQTQKLVVSIKESAG